MQRNSMKFALSCVAPSSKLQVFNQPIKTLVCLAALETNSALAFHLPPNHVLILCTYLILVYLYSYSYSYIYIYFLATGYI